MDWEVHQPEVRFDIRAERAEYEYLYKHPARALQDRLVRLGGGDRTKQIPISEWERVYQQEARVRRLLHQARVLAWGKQKKVLPRAQTGLTESAEKVQDEAAIPVGKPHGPRN